MSSSPPPPPPPYQTAQPAPPNAAWDRRTLREQRRAAVLQARRQRDLQRAELRATRRSSILGPLLLVTVGIAFLLLELGRFPLAYAATWFARWWPLVLVGAGFVLLAEWAFDTWIFAQRNTLAPHRRVGGGTGFLLSLLILAGVCAMAAQNRPAWIINNWNPEFADSLGLDQLFARHLDRTQEFTAPLGKGALLTIQNFRGNVTVSGVSQDGLVHVSAHQNLSAWQASELQAKSRRDRPVLEREGSGLVLRATGEDHDRTDLTIEVPHESALTLAPEKGEVTISELRGPVTVSEHGGSINLTALTGDVHLTSRDDNASISGHSLSGSLTLDGRSGDLALSDITGPVDLRGDFFGTTHLERIKGPVHFHTSFTDVACEAIPGELNIEGRSELEAHNVIGPVTVTTTERNLTLSGIHGATTLRDRNGSVTLALADPLAPVDVSTTHGSVQVQLPESSSFALSAETADGQVSNEWGLHPTQNNHRSTLAGQIRTGGPNVTLLTTDGDIKVRKGTRDGLTDNEADGPERSDHDMDTSSDSGDSHTGRHRGGV